MALRFGGQASPKPTHKHTKSPDCRQRESLFIAVPGLLRGTHYKQSCRAQPLDFGPRRAPQQKGLSKISSIRVGNYSVLGARERPRKSADSVLKSTSWVASAFLLPRTLPTPGVVLGGTGWHPLASAERSRRISAAHAQLLTLGSRMRVSAALTSAQQLSAAIPRTRHQATSKVTPSQLEIHSHGSLRWCTEIQASQLAKTPCNSARRPRIL